MSPSLLLCLASASVFKPSPAELSAAKTITPDVLKAHIRFLASDLLEGRFPATRGDQLAEAYVASQLEALGMKPTFQPFDIVGVNGHPDRITLEKGASKLELAFAQDFIAVSGKQQPRSKLDKAEVVFVGYGIVAPEYQWDDYKGTDLRGKVLLMMNNDPDWDPTLFAGETRLWYGRWDYKYESAAKTGAVGALIIHTTPSAGYPWQVVQTSWSGEQFSLPYESGPQLEVRGWTTEQASKKIAALGGHDLDALLTAARTRTFKPVPLGVTVSTAFQSTVQKKQTGNVLGSLKGSDPKLQDQAVIFTAHHDHLGVKKGAKEGTDAIYNGAVDNASGVAAMLAIARAFIALPKPPKRTIMFAAVAAEEQGLLGSEYLCHHLPMPAASFAADINIDGINILGRTKDIQLIGIGKSSLDEIVKAVAAYQHRVVKPDEFSDRGFFYRSDQFNFAKVGVPAAYSHGGLDYVGRPAGWGREEHEKWVKTHYHQPSDEIRDDWNLDGAVEDLQLFFYLGNQVAQTAARPTWNKGDEFAHLR